MTGTPSKDRAEAHETLAQVTADILNGMSVAFAGTGGFSILRGRIAAALEKSHADGIAEGMKRAAEIARDELVEIYDDSPDIDIECNNLVRRVLGCIEQEAR